MNNYITWDGEELKVGQKCWHKTLGFLAEIKSLEEDPHWMCAVKLKKTAEPYPPSSFLQEQPYEYFLRAWNIDVLPGN